LIYTTPAPVVPTFLILPCFSSAERYRDAVASEQCKSFSTSSLAIFPFFSISVMILSSFFCFCVWTFARAFTSNSRAACGDVFDVGLGVQSARLTPLVVWLVLRLSASLAVPPPRVLALAQPRLPDPPVRSVCLLPPAASALESAHSTARLQVPIPNLSAHLPVSEPFRLVERSLRSKARLEASRVSLVGEPDHLACPNSNAC